MDIQAIGLTSGLPVMNTQNLENTGSYDTFGGLLSELNSVQGVIDMQADLCKKFNVKLHTVNYACDTTDDTARSYDLAMIDSGTFYGGGNVVISQKTLEKMEKNVQFRNKVYDSIKALNETCGLAGGMIKSTGAVVHEDGTAGYWTEFDWGDESSEKKKRVLMEPSVSKLIENDDFTDFRAAETDQEFLAQIQAMMMESLKKKIAR